MVELKKSRINARYVFESIIINLLQVIVIKLLIHGDINGCIGYQCLFYGDFGRKILNIFPFSISVYLLLKFLDSEINISLVYILNRYEKFKNYFLNFMLFIIIHQVLIFLFVAVFYEIFILHRISILFIKYLLFYVVNNTLFFTFLSLATLYFRLNCFNMEIVNAIIISINIFIMAGVGQLFQYIKLLSFITLLPIIHLCLFNSNIDFLISTLIGISYICFAFLAVNRKAQKIDIIR